MSGENAKRFWKSLPEYNGDAAYLKAADEFPAPPDEPPPGWTRRSFLKAAGFAFAGAALAGCSTAPVQYAVPYVHAPAEMTPGESLHYASTCAGCSASCGLLAANRDGRPIKLEGNPEHPLSKGGLCAVGQASILGLYDRLRLQRPRINGQDKSWEDVDSAVRQELEQIHRRGGKVRFVSGTTTSPTTKHVIAQFVNSFADGQHIVYDALSCSAILDAHQQTHGKRLLPHYRLERADTIISFDADFLGTWISPVEFTAAYAARRVPDDETPTMSHHVQFESRLSLTGSKADRRICIAPAEMGLHLAYLAHKLAQAAGEPLEWPRATDVRHADYLDGLSRRLWREKENGKHSLILCGSQNVHHQHLCNFINHLLGNYGVTLDVTRPSYQCQGRDEEFHTLLDEIRNGQVDALFFYRCNPVYDLPQDNLADALRQVPIVVSFAERDDETARAARYVCPDHHFLESWNDTEPVHGLVSLTQPLIEPLGQTRSIMESLNVWLGQQHKTAYDIIRDYWRTNLLQLQSRHKIFEAFWNHTLHDGYAHLNRPPTTTEPFATDRLSETLRAAIQPLDGAPQSENGGTLVLYPKIALRDGAPAYNPWLQELPDPITKVTWDNYACLSPETAARLGLTSGDRVRLEVGNGDSRASIELPINVQPGQHNEVVAVALGYGSILSERFANIGPQWLEARPTVGENGMVGVNAAALSAWQNHQRSFVRHGVRLVKLHRHDPLACTQMHHHITVPAHLAPAEERRRPMIQETTLSALAGAHEQAHQAHHPHADLWPEDHPIEGHHWGMVIDLNACTGCSACVIACQVENNISVVGKDEVRRQREMHWLRIDRYYAGDGVDVEVSHQPMLCHHCDNAPCETVCPVLATVHSEEGLNQQVYNRCVGTRYCANNCPYKVRRFNWFDYPRDHARENLVLNPDVTVRSRGVMEKCTFCVQRIQRAKITARAQGEPLRDGDLQTACQQSCPAKAISFGDTNNHGSQVAQLQSSPRRYQVLDELNVRPSVSYLKVVRHRTTEGENRG